MNEEEIFLQAIEIDSPDQREVFLTEVCGEDSELRARVEALLKSHEAASGFLQEPTELHSNDERPDEADLLPEQASVPYFGNYEVLNLIARGGMGVVYRARQVKLNRIVALKTMLAGRLASAEEIQRFQTEAEAAARLDHPHIVPIYEVGEHENMHYFSMGFVDGESLARMYDRALPAPRKAAELMATVADAVQYAHTQDVIHRDLKPANILIDGDGQPRITDFGLAKRVDVDQGLTGTGQVLGSPGYMAPEQIRDAAEISPATDVYAMGAVLYRLLTGRPPFHSDNPVDTMLQTVNNDVVPPRLLTPNVPRDLEAIVLKALAKRPSHRYSSASEFREELGRYLDGQPILTRRQPRWRKAIQGDFNILIASSLPEIICLAGAILVLVTPLLRSENYYNPVSSPDTVRALIAGTAICLMCAAAELFKWTLAAALLMATLLFGFSEGTAFQLTVESRLSLPEWFGASRSDETHLSMSAIWLIGNLLLLVCGSVAGIIRQEDRREEQNYGFTPDSLLSFIAGIGVIASEMFICARPMVAYNVFGDISAFDFHLVIQLMAFVVICLLIGKRRLQYLFIPALAIIMSAVMLAAYDGIYACLILVGVSAWDCLSPQGTDESAKTKPESSAQFLQPGLQSRSWTVSSLASLVSAVFWVLLSVSFMVHDLSFRGYGSFFVATLIAGGVNLWSFLLAFRNQGIPTPEIAAVRLTTLVTPVVSMLIAVVIVWLFALEHTGPVEAAVAVCSGVLPVLGWLRQFHFVGTRGMVIGLLVIPALWLACLAT